MPELSEEVVMDELVHAGKENAKTGMGVVPADDHRSVVRIEFGQTVIHVAPTLGRIGDTSPVHAGVLGDDHIADVHHVTPVGLFFGRRANQDAGHFAVWAADGMGLGIAKSGLVDQNVDS